MDTSPTLFIASDDQRAGLPRMFSIPYRNRLYHTRILHAQYDACPQGRRKSPHAHPLYHIILVTRGTGRFIIDNTAHPVARGRLFLVSPNTPHTFTRLPDETYRYDEVTFECIDESGRRLDAPFADMLGAWLNRHAENRLSCDCPLAVCDLLQVHIRTLVREGTAAGADPAPAVLLHLISLCLEVYHQCVEVTGGMSPSPMERVRRHLLSHPGEQVTLSQLSEAVALSPNYLSRRFKQQFGTTPIHWHLEQRMIRAATMLRSMEYSIKHIAARVGFEDVYAFSKTFKKHIGSSPAAYRKKKAGTRAILRPGFPRRDTP